MACDPPRKLRRRNSYEATSCAPHKAVIVLDYLLSLYRRLGLLQNASRKSNRPHIFPHDFCSLTDRSAVSFPTPQLFLGGSMVRRAALCFALFVATTCGGGGGSQTGPNGLPLAPSSLGSTIRVTVRPAGSATASVPNPQISATVTLENNSVTAVSVGNSSTDTTFTFDGVQEGSHTVTGQMTAASVRIELISVPKNGTFPGVVVQGGSIQNVEGPPSMIVGCAITYGATVAPIPVPPYPTQSFRFQFQVVSQASTRNAAVQCANPNG